MQVARECLVSMGHGQAELTMPSGVWVFLSDELRQAGFQVDEYSPEPASWGASKPITWIGLVLYDNDVNFVRQLAAACRRQGLSLKRKKS